jgi:propanol-preferring alcohol dehydrogenase
MKAVRLLAAGQPLVEQEVSLPPLGDRDILLRVRAAGICHSDVHYRARKSPPAPLTLGHEVAGVIEAVGPAVTRVRPGDRVCLHYLVTCGQCSFCIRGQEQFCPDGKMLGNTIDGGYAEYVVAPERNAIPLPSTIPFEQGATLMCASATSLHALGKARLKAGETVAVFGVGGLGMSAIQLARALGALEVYAVDINPGKLALAEQRHAIPIDATGQDPVVAIRTRTGERGVDVSLELIGLPKTMRQAIQVLAPLGRAVIVGITEQPLQLDPYREILGPETEIIGSNDHLLAELPLLVEYARRGLLDLSDVVSRTVPLEARAINQVLDELDRFGDAVRTVITPPR